MTDIDMEVFNLCAGGCSFLSDDLYIGGAVIGDGSVFRHFDIVVLCAGEWQPHIPLPEDAPHKRILRVPFDDTNSALTPSVVSHVEKTVKMIAEELLAGRKVLVSCLAGQNRSALVCALILMELGFDANEAIQCIQDMHNHAALSNKTFRKYIRTRTK